MSDAARKLTHEELETARSSGEHVYDGPKLVKGPARDPRRLEFIPLLKKHRNMSKTCSILGISRRSGHKWLKESKAGTLLEGRFDVE